MAAWNQKKSWPLLVLFLLLLKICVMAVLVVPRVAAGVVYQHGSLPPPVSPPTAPVSPPTVFVFGDSLADAGTNNYVADVRARANYPHNGVDYPGGVPTGRFSNSYNGVDFIAMYMGLQQSPPPYLSFADDSQAFHGANFASGGSGILNDTGAQYGVISLEKQVEQFKNVTLALAQAKGTVATAAALSASFNMFSTGNNDIFAYFVNSSGATNPVANSQFIAMLVSEFQSHLTDIYNLGAKKFAIFGLSHIGCPPAITSVAGGVCVETLNILARQFNVAAKVMLNHLSMTLTGFRYSYADTYDFATRVRANPQHYGIVDVDNACCGTGNMGGGGPCTPQASLCPTRSNHFFWDWFHPTATVYNLTAKSVYFGHYANPMNFMQLALQSP